MRYLYGDCSPFPLNHNFLDTLSAAIDAAVALLEVDETIGRAQHLTEEANTVALTELGDLDRYGQRVAQALADRDGLSKASSRIIGDVAQAAARELDRARAGIKAWRQATIERAYEGCGPAALSAPIERFFSRYDLPHAVWGLRWRSGGREEPVEAQAYAATRHGLCATLAVAIPKKHAWARPVRVGQLEKNACLALPGKTMFGRQAVVRERLDRYFVARVTHTTEREAFILARRAKAPSAGLRLSVREGEQCRVTATRLDAGERPAGEPIVLEGAQAAIVKRLWERIKDTILDLVSHRGRLIAATLHDQPVGLLQSPAPIALHFVESVASLARQVLRKSHSAGELQLKRELGDGRREELFVATRELTQKYARLSAKNRELFDALGLADGEAREPALRRSLRPAPLGRATPRDQPRGEATAPAPAMPLTQPPKAGTNEPASEPPRSAPRPVQPDPVAARMPPPLPFPKLPVPSLPPRRPLLRVAAGAVPAREVGHPSRAAAVDFFGAGEAPRRSARVERAS